MPGEASSPGIMLLAYHIPNRLLGLSIQNLSLMSQTAMSLQSFGSTIRRRFLESEALRGFGLLSPTLLAMVFGLAMPLLILFTLSFWLQDYVDFIKHSRGRTTQTFLPSPFTG